MHFTNDDIRRIKDASNGHLLEVVQDFREVRKSGVSYVCDCPSCGGRHKFSVNPAKDLFNCFACNQLKGSGATAYLTKVEGKGITETWEYLAKKFNVILDTPAVTTKPAPKMKKQSKETKGNDADSYCSRMLAASGLNYKDVTAKCYRNSDNSSVYEAKTFRPGTLGPKGDITTGDDVIIEYYDLNGFPVTYIPSDKRNKGTAEPQEYFRVRWQFPESHLDKEGKPYKYRSPRGSGTPIYIPQRLRELYQKGAEIPRLYIQEGEKKAEKACKHGIPSIAVSGIQNLGCNGNLPEDIVRIIQYCKVKEVAFIFDSDWDDISNNLKINDQVEKRPRNFFFAARNYKEYMRSLKNRNIYVEIFLGHIKKNDADDKGLDDLLANTLRDNEDKLAKDIEFACNDKKGQGEYVEMFKITSLTDHKLQELWGLHSHEVFAARHKEVLSNMPEFRFGNSTWKYDDTGKIVSAQPLDADEQFWNVVTRSTRSGEERTEYEFCYVNSQIFLQNKGFGRYRRLDNTYQFIHVDSPVVKTIEASDARDYLFQFAKHNCNKAVNEMLIKGVSQYVGPEKLALLDFVEPHFLDPKTDSQYFYFANTTWLVSEDSVHQQGYESITHNIWAEQKRNYSAEYIGKLIEFEHDGENYSYKLTKDGQNCHFLQFLINCSNFTWRKAAGDITPEEINENNIHLLSKLCAIGFMCMEAKDSNVARAVIGMDGKQSEVGESNGRSGKSLIGELIRNVMPIAYISGKKTDMFNDQFVWNDVQENTKLVFIDDVLQSFNFEFLFPNITGDWSVNYKGGRRVTFPFLRSPKLYISTNHAIKGMEGSFTDRQWLLAFSDFYNETHKPKDDFGLRFFSDWEYDQWNLCWNLIANCVQLYLQFGVIEAPGERLERRKLRQSMGEVFVSWADEYFTDNKDHLNARIPRKELYDAFCNYDPGVKKFTTPTAFKKKLQMFTEWKGYIFNPKRYDPVTGQPLEYDKDGRPVVDDKAGGVEYFTISPDWNSPIREKRDPMNLPNDNEPIIDF